MAVTEAELMRECSPLYPTIAIEAFSGVVMGFMFLYLWAKVSTKNDLQSPASAAFRFTAYAWRTAWKDLKMNMGRWPEMAVATMGERFAFCRKANQAILLFQAFVAFISITRWLHIGNINGFRYLGYAITCPPMQAQLILLIAPVVPCYRMAFVVTLFITFVMLITGWAASMRKEPLLNCGWDGLIVWDQDCFDYTNKFWTIAPAICVQMFLSFVQIPILALLYVAHGGGRNPLLPPGYLKLLCIVAFTWLGFPVWWFFSYEGMGMLQDTKLNSVGFLILNVVSKGALSFQVLRMTKEYRINQAASGNRESGMALGLGRQRSGSTDSYDGSCFRDPRDLSKEASECSSATAWILRFLKNFDDGGSGMPPNASQVPAPGQQDHCRNCRGSSDEIDLKGSDWARQHSGLSLISTAAESGLESGSGGSMQIWERLEPTYKRFLKDAGVQPNEFVKMSLLDKAELRASFDKVANSGLVNTAGNIGVYDRSVTLADASDDQIIKEMQRRLKGGVVAKPVTVGKRAAEHGFEFDGIEDKDDLSIPECEVDSSAPGGRRGYHV